MDRENEITMIAKRIQNYDINTYRKFINMIKMAPDYSQGVFREECSIEELNKINVSALKNIATVNIRGQSNMNIIMGRVKALEPINDDSIDFV